MRIYPFFIPHAGCPHRCLFCDQHRISGKTAAPRPGEVAGELETILAARGGGEVAFYGGSFTLLPVEAQRAYLDSVAPFAAEERVAGIRISTRPDALTSPVVDFLAESGVTTVEIGCQSFSSEVLEKAGRGHGPHHAGEAVGNLRRRGLTVGLQLMPGLPGGDRAEALLSLERAIGLVPDFLRIYPTVVLRDSGLEDLYRAGRYRPFDLETAVDLGARMLWRCREAGIPVIRFGLQAETELDRGDALVGGPYHPALGQMVRSRLWRRALTRLFGMSGAGPVRVHPNDLSDAVGHGRDNRRYLDQRFGSCELRTCPELPREHLARGEQIFSLQALASYEESVLH